MAKAICHIASVNCAISPHRIHSHIHTSAANANANAPSRIKLVKLDESAMDKKSTDNTDSEETEESDNAKKNDGK